MSVSRILPRFQRLLERRPLLMNAVIYGSFYTGAEFVQQTYSKVFNHTQPTAKVNVDDYAERSGFKLMQKFNETLRLVDSPIEGEYNWSQLRRYALYGCFLAGPILHTWYKFLDGFYKGKSMNIVVKKLLVDQFILTPPLIVIFFSSMSLMEGKSDILAECKAKFVKTFQTSCLYWLPVQFVNFALVPPALRVVFVSIATFTWANILCYLKSTPHVAEDSKPAEIVR